MFLLFRIILKINILVNRIIVQSFIRFIEMANKNNNNNANAWRFIKKKLYEDQNIKM